MEKAAEKNLDLASLSEEEQLQEWKKRHVTSRTRFNSIYIDNSKLDSEGESNKSFGSIYSKRYDGDEEIVEKLPEGFSFFPIITRVQIECRNYETDANGKKYPAYICKEVDQFADIEVVDFVTKEVVFTGPYKEAKEPYGLKYKVAIYAYYNDHIYRWLISGKDTLGSWFGINNQMNEDGRPLEVILKSITPQNHGSIYWNDLAFELGKPFDVKLALELDDSLREQFSSTKTEAIEAPEEVETDEALEEVVIDSVSI